MVNLFITLKQLSRLNKGVCQIRNVGAKLCNLCKKHFQEMTQANISRTKQYQKNVLSKDCIDSRGHIIMMLFLI